MADDLVLRRDQIMTVAYEALDAVWPKRKGDEFVRAIRSAISELESIAAEMGRRHVDAVEQSRTYRLLGDLTVELEPSLGREMLLGARALYEKAEALLQGPGDDLERAKLNFNFANTLRQIDATDIRQLSQAKQRLLAARKYFAANDARRVGMVDDALRSVEGLLAIAPLANATTDVLVTDQVVGGRSETLNEQMLSLVAARLASVAKEGVASKERVDTLHGVLEEFGRIVSGPEADTEALLEKQQRVAELLDSKLEMAHYPSYGLARPPAGSRAACLVEQNWQLRRYLLEEMARTGKGEQESKEAIELSMRADRVDKRLYAAAADAALASAVEKDELRPLALAIRSFSSRTYVMPARPIWPSGRLPIDTNAVFYSGSIEGRRLATSACGHSRLEVMPEPVGESYASARWTQLLRSMVGIFDLRAGDPRSLAAVSYELGIALTLGRPVVVLIEDGQRMPFDVDVVPVVLAGGPADTEAVACALDRSVTWTYPRPRTSASCQTLEYVLSNQQEDSDQPQQNIYVGQTLTMLARLRETGDPLTIARTITKLFEYLNDGKTVLIRPHWPPAYPGQQERRLFHVMPFRPRWADDVAGIARQTSERAGVTYVRGDEVSDPDIILSIWQELARATHVLVDLSGFNANVALELGIAHTLGKKVLIVGQGETVDRLFPAVSKLRVSEYSVERLRPTLGAAVKTFVET